jgi:hypothetical protein
MSTGDQQVMSAEPVRSTLSQLTRLSELLVRRATGPAFDSTEYQGLRDALLRHAELRPVLPRFIFDCRDLEQFFQFVRDGRGTYADRKEFIWKSFRPAFELLESGFHLGGTTVPAVSGLPGTGSHVFISYSTVDKQFGGQVQRLFSDFGVAGFLAHESIQVSEAWRDRILAELQQCKIFVPVLSKSFLTSIWTQQEIGAVALREGVTVAPISLDGTTPPGFLERYQCIFVRNAELSSEALIRPLVPRCPRVFIPGLVDRVARSPNFREGEARLAWLRPVFSALLISELDALVDACIDNGQVHDAHECRMVLLPELLQIRGHDIDPIKLDRLCKVAHISRP